jgi:magnesium chelatase family protein
VVAARALQRERYRGMPGISTNADAKSRDLKDICRLDEKAARKFREQLERLRFSARAYDRVLRVARTCADLKGRADVAEEDVFRAAQYRQLDNGSDSFWA